MHVFAVEVFFDGDCPLCTKEINLLRWMDRRGRILFTDISRPEFDANAFGLTQDEVMARIHGRLPGGEIIEGVEVFRKLYGAVGFGPLVVLTRIPGISHGLDVLYRFFAKHRLALTGRRCTEDTCSIEGPKSQAGAE